MKRKELTLLFLFSLLVLSVIAFFQRSPGYMDAEYYFGGGVRLFQGKGFSEILLWNFLDDPRSIPHPSHGYWYPLASIVAYLGMSLFGSASFAAGRFFFLIIGAALSPMMALATFEIFKDQKKAIMAGLLTVFSGFFTPFIPTSDNYGLIMLGSICLLWLLYSKGEWRYFVMGLVIGSMNLARSDSLLWLVIIVGAVTTEAYAERSPRKGLARVAWLMLAYLAVMSPLFIRNQLAFGSLFSAGGGRMLWLTEYSDTFAWPPDRLTFANWWSQGWQAILMDRWHALLTNTGNFLFAQVGVLNLIWAALGIYQLRKDERIRWLVFGLFSLWIVMSVAFPYASVHGSYFHASAGFAPLVILSVIEGVDFASKTFRIANLWVYVLVIAGVYTGIVVMNAAKISEADRFERILSKAETLIVADGAEAEQMVMTADPPGYTNLTGRPSLSIPNENIDTTLKLAEKFNVRYIITDGPHCRPKLTDLCAGINIDPRLELLAIVEDELVYKIK